MYFRAVAIIFPLYVVANCSRLQPKVDKPYKLLLFATASWTGYEPRDGKICQAAMQVAADYANSRHDFLSDYEIVPIFKDEGRVALKSPRAFIEYLHEAEEAVARDKTKTTFIAPAMIGLARSCHRISEITSLFKMTMFSPGCSGPRFNNKQKYGHVYRNRIPSGTQYLVPLIFLDKYNRNWNQFANIQFEYFNENRVNKETKIGRLKKLPTLFIGDWADKDFYAIANSDARILFVASGGSRLFTKFICKAYSYGIRAPLFLFMTSSSNFNDPYSDGLILPDGCSVQMFKEQIEITLFGGVFDFALKDHGKTDFGYDGKEFTKLLDNLTNNSRSADYVRRHRCHDAMQMALLSMNNSEQELQKINKSLGDFWENKQLVRKYVNESAAASDFIGLRIGRIKYPPQIDLFFEPQLVGQWVGGDIRILMKTWINESDFENRRDMSRYNFKRVDDPKWYTIDGLPPKDLFTVIVDSDAFSYTAFGILLFFIVVAVICLGFFGLKSFQRFRSTKDRLKLFFSDLIIIFGGILVNIAAISLALPAFGTTLMEFMCPLQLVLCVIATFIVSGSVIGRFHGVFKTLGDPEIIKAMSMIQSSKLSKRSKKKQLAKKNALAKLELPSQSKIVILTAIISLLGVAVAVVWIIFYPLKPDSHAYPAYFDSETDSYRRTIRYFCTGEMIEYFGYLCVALILLFLFWELILAVGVRKSPVHKLAKAEFQATRIAVINSMTILLAGAFLMFVFAPEQTTEKAVILAFALYFYGNSCSVILLSQNIINPRASSTAVGSSKNIRGKT